VYKRQRGLGDVYKRQLLEKKRRFGSLKPNKPKKYLTNYTITSKHLKQNLKKSLVLKLLMVKKNIKKMIWMPVRVC
jgi:hypothetical protein